MGQQENNLSSGAQRVQDVLNTFGMKLTVLELPDSTRTAKDAANAIGCEARHIAKSLLFRERESGQPVLVIASGINRVNEKKIGEINGEAIEKADADFVRERTGFAIGGVPPVGHLEEIKTFIDEDLFGYETIWAAAGTPNAVFKLTPADLLKMTKGNKVSIE